MKARSSCGCQTGRLGCPGRAHGPPVDAHCLVSDWARILRERGGPRPDRPSDRLTAGDSGARQLPDRRDARRQHLRRPIDDRAGTRPLSFRWEITGDDVRVVAGRTDEPKLTVRLFGSHPATVLLTVTDEEGMSSSARLQLQLTVR